jgi:hypothetical protein
MGTKLTSGNKFSFPKEHGFSGSCGGTAVSSYMRGGHVHKRQKTAAPIKGPPASGPKMTNQHKTTPQAYAKGGKIHPSDKEHRDYDDRNDTPDRADYPEAGTASKPEGYAKGGHWIKGAIKHPGIEKRAAKRAGESTHKYMEQHKHSAGKAGERARLGLKLSAMHAKGGEIEREELHEPKGTPSEPYEASARGGSITKRAKGGYLGASKTNLKAGRQETHHKESSRTEVAREHDHHGKAKERDGHSTPHPFAYGGRMPGPVMGAKHRARMNPMVGGAAPGVMRAPAAPMAPQGMGALGGGMPGMPGMKRGGRR